eukprot:TRINITY_DN12325_c0_g1_i1.p1 TRINITY_DN12325_c0_g1~~TRINITY_DN12325_c0_g1_i1.p1  ORF type:complete len:150 (+),score=12.84 TRINITY_DN12325_c0_g1_i1:95-544(+)
MGNSWSKSSSDCGTITVEVVQARNLVNFDVAGENGDLTDAYMQVTLIDSVGGEVKQQTQVVSDNLNPEFHETFVFPLQEPLLTSTQLLVRCFDSDEVVDEFMGDTRLELVKLRRYFFVDDWFPLINGEDREVGQVRLVVSFKPPDLDQD